MQENTGIQGSNLSLLDVLDFAVLLSRYLLLLDKPFIDTFPKAKVLINLVHIPVTF